jgi:hypothetical protein
VSPEDHEVVQEAALLYGHNPPPKPAYGQAPAGAAEEPLAPVGKGEARKPTVAAETETGFAISSRKLATADYA